MCFRLCLSMLSGLALGVFATGQSFAGIIVSFSPSTPSPLIAGGSGTVDVFARANAGTESLDGFVLQVSLTPTGGSPAGGLIFSNTQSESQLGIGGANGYVFFGNSLAQNSAVPIGIVNPSGSLYTGSDQTNDFVPFSLTTTNSLLYRLDLTAVAPGTYDITALLQPDSFFSDQLDPVGTAITAITGTTTLTVGAAAAAVPEPSSMVLLALGSGAMGFYRLRRQRREADLATSST